MHWVVIELIFCEADAYSFDGYTASLLHSWLVQTDWVLRGYPVKPGLLCTALRIIWSVMPLEVISLDFVLSCPDYAFKDCHACVRTGLQLHRLNYAARLTSPCVVVSFGLWGYSWSQGGLQAAYAALAALAPLGLQLTFTCLCSCFFTSSLHVHAHVCDLSVYLPLDY